MGYVSMQQTLFSGKLSEHHTLLNVTEYHVRTYSYNLHILLDQSIEQNISCLKD